MVKVIFPPIFLPFGIAHRHLVTEGRWREFQTQLAAVADQGEVMEEPPVSSHRWRGGFFVAERDGGEGGFRPIGVVP